MLAREICSLRSNSCLLVKDSCVVLVEIWVQGKQDLGARYNFVILNRIGESLYQGHVRALAVRFCPYGMHCISPGPGNALLYSQTCKVHKDRAIKMETTGEYDMERGI